MSSQQVTALVSSGLSSPYGVAVDGQGNVYIADTGNSAIKKLNGPNPATLVSSGLGAPVGVALDGQGNVYIADARNSAIEKWNVSNSQLTTLVSGLFVPLGVAIDGQGNVYIAENGFKDIKKWNVSNQQVTTLVPSGLKSPFGVAVDGQGNVYIADHGISEIIKWSVSIQQPTILEGSGLSPPSGVAVDGQGNVYVADSTNNAIRKWSPVNQQLTTLVSSGLSNPTGIAVDGQGNVYIADTHNNAVKKWSPMNQQLTTLVSSGLNSPEGVAVDGQGNVYIADTGNNAIKKWTPTPSASGGGPVINSVVTVYAGAGISQNTWVAVKGTNLVPASTSAAGQDWSKAPEFASGQMPTQLGGVSVTINGKPAYIYFFCSAVTNKDCTQDQINLLTPLDNTLGAVSVVVTNNGASSAPFASTLRSSSPSFFQWAGRYAVATHADGSLVGPTTLYPGASTPARTNEIIGLWMTGFGLPANSLVQGSASQSGSLPTNPVIQFNGTPAAISYAAVVSPGLYQINLTVPPNVPSGDIAVSASYGGGSAPTGSFINALSSSGAAPVISSFTASPPTIQAGQSSTLSWSVSNATSIVIDNGIGSVSSNGTRSALPGSTTTYTLTASNASGSVTAKATVTVSSSPSTGIQSGTFSGSNTFVGPSDNLLATGQWTITITKGTDAYSDSRVTGTVTITNVSSCAIAFEANPSNKTVAHVWYADPTYPRGNPVGTCCLSGISESLFPFPLPVGPNTFSVAADIYSTATKILSVAPYLTFLDNDTDYSKTATTGIVKATNPYWGACKSNLP